MSTYTISEQLQGFPVFQMVVLGFLRIGEPIAFTSMFPYIYFMIKSFNIAENEADISRYSGYLASAFSFCQFLSTVHWARASNRFGRKTILLCGVAGTAIAMIVFGMSTNFYMALFARSLMGLLNGNVSIMRTTVGEIAHQKRHQALAFSNLSLIWSLGKCVGGWLGGVLTNTKDIVDNMGAVGSKSDQFFRAHPFAFSNFVVASILFTFIIVAWLFLEETHEDLKDSRDIGLEVGDAIRKRLGFDVPERPWKTNQYDSESADPLLDEETEESITVLELHAYSTKGRTGEEDEDHSSEESSTEEVEKTGIPTPVLNCIFNNFMCSFQNLIYVEFLPVLLAKRLMLDDLKFPLHIKGGFGFTSASIGTFISFTGLIGVFLSTFLFPVITKYCSPVIGYRIGLSLYPFIYFLLPLYIFTLHDYNPNIPGFVTSSLLYFNGSVISFINGMTFTQILMLIHGASPPKQRALINSYAMSITALARCAAPILWGWLISKCDAAGYGGISWWLLSLWAFIAFSQSFRLKETQEDELT
ncbi:major facilitator superfamily [Scheffersomyces xylosifermentans]|uniref:major facilitator superfamily n=1 Tax=Scheffersomyces xylosifermentans TaxID=1304137 RepID=UPI00315CD298